MLRASLLHQHVSRLRKPKTLHCLLQGRFEVGDGKRAAALLHALQLRRDHIAQYKFAGYLQPAVEIDSCQDRFQGIDQQSGFATSAALFFSAAQPQVVAQLQLLCYLDEVPFADQMGSQFGKLPFTKLGKTLKQLLACNQREHGIAQKLELLVVANFIFALARRLRFLLPGL